MNYAGPVYDGPLRGEYREGNSPLFFIAKADPQPGALVNVQAVKDVYHWSNALRSWVFAGA